MQGKYEIDSFFEVRKLYMSIVFSFLFICCNFMPIEHLTLFAHFRTSSQEEQLNIEHFGFFSNNFLNRCCI